MKKLMILLLLLTSCSKPISGPKFKEGECFESSYRSCEAWDKNCDHYVEIVFEVGKKNYHAMYTNLAEGRTGGYRLLNESFYLTDDTSRKTECPQILKEQYERFKTGK